MRLSFFVKGLIPLNFLNELLSHPFKISVIPFPYSLFISSGFHRNTSRFQEPKI